MFYIKFFNLVDFTHIVARMRIYLYSLLFITNIGYILHLIPGYFHIIIHKMAKTTKNNGKIKGKSVKSGNITKKPKKDSISNTKKPKRSVQIRLVGTSHIAKQSVEEVKTSIEQFKPDIVAIELDKGRLHALLTKQKSKTPLWAIFKIGVVGYLFAKLGSWGSRKLGKIVGVEPGDEMLTAVRLAKKNNIRLALVDQPIEITLRRFSARVTFREKMRFIGDVFKSVIFRKKAAKEMGIDFNNFDLSKVPSNELIKNMVKIMKAKYPNAYSVLVDERNKVMAMNLLRLAKKYDNILAIVGAGHLEGMKEEMDKMTKK
jgi:pheromone shutdown-related protein TraB